MIIVDTSVWIDHMRRQDDVLFELLDGERVLGHAYVTGELAMGNPPHRPATLKDLSDLPQCELATPFELLEFVNRYTLFGIGLGYIDAHLLASAMLGGATIWTRDKRLDGAAARLGVSSGLR